MAKQKLRLGATVTVTLGEGCGERLKQKDIKRMKDEVAAAVNNCSFATTAEAKCRKVTLEEVE